MKKYFAAFAVLAAASCALYAQAPAAEKPAAPAAPAVKVEKIVTAAGVENREPVGESSAFAAGTERVYTWTRLSAGLTPVRIKHVYYLGDKKAGEIELAVNGSPYRVWSWKSVKPGNWKVETTDETGAVLASVVFTVAGGTAPAAAKQEAPAK